MPTYTYKASDAAAHYATPAPAAGKPNDAAPAGQTATGTQLANGQYQYYSSGGKAYTSNVPPPGAANTAFNTAPNTPAPTPGATPTTPPTAPNNAQVTPPNAPLPQGSSYVSETQATQNLANAPLSASEKTSVANNLKNAYHTGFNNANAAGVNPGTSSNGGTQIAKNFVDTSNQEDHSQQVDTAYQTNPSLSKIPQEILDWVSPKNTNDVLQKYVDQYATDRQELAGLKTELMNNKRVIAGTEDELRDEITKAGGFATDSQIKALALARNKYLIADSSRITDLIQSGQDAINTDVTLMGFAKDQANTQFNQRMSLLNYQQQNAQFSFNAAKDQIKTNISLMGADGYYASLKDHPQQLQYVESILGTPGGLAIAAKQATLDRANKTTMDSLDIQAKQASIRASNASTAKTYADMGTGGNNTPAILSPYTRQSYDGTQYADLSSLTPSEKSKYAQIAQNAGIKPILDTGTASKLSGISVSKENIQNIRDSITNGKLLNDTDNPTQQGISNTLSGLFGNADVKSFRAWRTAIINNVQALAGGQGSGLRINAAEINAAMENDLPVITGPNADNLSTANAKLDKLTSQLDTWNKQILGGGNTAASHVPPIGTVIEQKQSDGTTKKYHVIDAQGNIEPLK